MDPVVQSAAVNLVVRGPRDTPEATTAQIEGAIEEAIHDLLVEEGADKDVVVHATANLTNR